MRRCVRVSRWRDRPRLGVLHGAVGAALVVAACGPAPVYTRYSLSETGGAGIGGVSRDAGSEIATGGTGLFAGGGGAATGGAAGGGGTGGATSGAATGGAATGGAAGRGGGPPATGGSATGGSATGGSATGGAATGGAATGGAATGGDGTGGAATGGAGTGGAATGGTGSGGVGTGGGATGGSGSGGTSASLQPCSGLCANPVVIPLDMAYSSGNLGTGASCYETKRPLAGGNCGNFVSPRTVHVNGVAEPCDTGGNWTSLPAPRSGGHCVQVSAGDHSFAYLTLW